MKFGLVVEGGANRSIFACGAMDALLENGIFADYFIGTSAGIANGISYLSKQPRRNLEILERYVNDRRYMGKRHLLNPFNRSYYNRQFVFADIPAQYVPFDFDAFAAYPGRAVAVVTNMLTGQAEYREVERDDPEFRVLQASCALPLLFPKIVLDGIPYMDGGVCDSIPFRHAMEEGCDRILVLLTREKGYRKQPEKALELAEKRYRKYPQFCAALHNRTESYNRSVDELDTLEAKGTVLTIRPADTAHFGRLERDVEKIRAFYQEGYDQTIQRLPEIRAYLQEK